MVIELLKVKTIDICDAEFNSSQVKSEFNIIKNQCILAINKTPSKKHLYTNQYSKALIYYINSSNNFSNEDKLVLFNNMLEFFVLNEEYVINEDEILKNEDLLEYISTMLILENNLIKLYSNNIINKSGVFENFTLEEFKDVYLNDLYFIKNVMRSSNNLSNAIFTNRSGLLFLHNTKCITNNLILNSYQISSLFVGALIIHLIMIGNIFISSISKLIIKMSKINNNIIFMIDPMKSPFYSH